MVGKLQEDFGIVFGIFPRLIKNLGRLFQISRVREPRGDYRLTKLAERGGLITSSSQLH